MDAELSDFRKLMIKGLTLKETNDEYSDCSDYVIYIDINATTLFCGKMKHCKDAAYYLFSDFNGLTKYQENDLILTFREKTLFLKFSQSKIRDYMHRMLTRLFTEKYD